MQVFEIEPQGFAANSYLVTKDNKRAIAIDPAQPRIGEEARRLGLQVETVLLTHGHFDHIGGCAALRAAGAKVGCLAGEEDTALFHNLGEAHGVRIPPFVIDFVFHGGEELFLAGLKIKVLKTPGHTSGSACFLAEDQTEAALFTGDTLFAGTVGRTDLPTGSMPALLRSLKELSALEFEGTIYPGHGAASTLKYEKTYNGWLKC